MVKIANTLLLSEIEAAIFAWIDLLAEENYAAAIQFTLHDPYYGWTPLLLESVINGYGLPFENDFEHKHKVTKRETAAFESGRQYKEINLYANSRPSVNERFVVTGDAYFDLPIDGQWSDLTATFSLLLSKEFAALELNDIHVL